MSKVSTLIKFIAYQKQHPHANDSQIAEAVGITPRYLRECKGDVNLLKHYLSDHPLDADQIRFLMSMLDRHNPYQRTIYQQLQKQPLEIQFDDKLSHYADFIQNMSRLVVHRRF